MNVVVIGAGNIGTTLAQLLLRHRARLGIDVVSVVKNDPQPFFEVELRQLEELGAEVVRASSAAERWRAVDASDYVFDCRKEGAPLRDKSEYQARGHLRGVCAQGSEEGFGVPMVAGTNDGVVRSTSDEPCLVHVASCNTHAAVSLLRAACGTTLETLEHADFVFVRRSEDIGSSERLVGANVVARHRSRNFGTNHSILAQRVFASVGASPELTSSDITTPSQLLHAVRFSIHGRAPLEPRFELDPWLATTHRFDSNRVFEFGRRHGEAGRLYAHAIVVDNNLVVRDTQIIGWAFVPQEGNTLLTTLAAFLYCTQSTRAQDVLREMRRKLVLHRC